MITFEIIDNVLKNVYLEVLRHQLNIEVDPIIAKIKQTSNYVYGKEIIKYVDINGKFFNFKEDLKNIYCSIKISDKAFRGSQNNHSALVELLNNEMETLLNETKSKIKNAFYDEDKKPEYILEDVDYNSICFTGLKDLFDINKETLYGVNRKENKEVNPIVTFIDKFEPIKLQEIVYNNNEDIDFIICSKKIKRDYQQFLLEHNRELKKANLLNDLIPIVSEKIPDDTIYLINSNDFTFNQLCDWLWLEDESGNILIKEQCDTFYKAILVKYGNFICEKPNKQIMIKIEGEKI